MTIPSLLAVAADCLDSEGEFAVEFIEQVAVGLFQLVARGLLTPALLVLSLLLGLLFKASLAAFEVLVGVLVYLWNELALGVAVRSLWLVSGTPGGHWLRYSLTNGTFAHRRTV